MKEALADLQRSEKDKFERINRIKSLLAKASALLNADKRPLHALNDVQDKLVAVQKMDSQNAELPVLRSLLIEATTEGAMAAAGSRNFKLANSHIALLNTIAPDLANVTQIKAAIAAEKVRIEDERKQRLQDDYEAVKVLIAEANTAIDKDFLSSPKGESALDKLRMVIKVDPDNADAKKAMGRIVRRYITLASLALNDDKMVTAEKYVSNAEGLYEKYKTTGVSGSAVKGIRSSVNRVIQLTDVTLPLKRLRALNKTIKSQSRPVPEDVKEAYEIFLIVASKEPKHKTVKAAKKLIANAYAELSNSAIKKKDNDSAVSYISRGLKVDPNHRGLKRAKKRMQGEESGFMDFLWN